MAISSFQKFINTFSMHSQFLPVSSRSASSFPGNSITRKQSAMSSSISNGDSSSPSSTQSNSSSVVTKPNKQPKRHNSPTNPPPNWTNSPNNQIQTSTRSIHKE